MLLLSVHDEPQVGERVVPVTNPSQNSRLHATDQLPVLATFVEGFRTREEPSRDGQLTKNVHAQTMCCSPSHPSAGRGAVDNSAESRIPKHNVPAWPDRLRCRVVAGEWRCGLPRDVGKPAPPTANLVWEVQKGLQPLGNRHHPRPSWPPPRQRALLAYPALLGDGQGGDQLRRTVRGEPVAAVEGVGTVVA